MTIVNIHHAKTHLSALLKRVLSGEEIIIAKSGRPVAKLVPLTADRPRRVLGGAQGQVWVAPDFDAPLPSDVLAEFENQ